MYYYATLAASFEFTGEDKIKFALAAYNAGLGRVVDAMTIANYFGKDYNKWDNVRNTILILRLIRIRCTDLSGRRRDVRRAERLTTGRSLIST